MDLQSVLSSISSVVSYSVQWNVNVVLKIQWLWWHCSGILLLGFSGSGAKGKVKKDPTQLPLFDVYSHSEKHLQLYKIQLLTTIAEVFSDESFVVPVSVTHPMWYAVQPVNDNLPWTSSPRVIPFGRFLICHHIHTQQSWHLHIRRFFSFCDLPWFYGFVYVLLVFFAQQVTMWLPYHKIVLVVGQVTSDCPMQPTLNVKQSLARKSCCLDQLLILTGFSPL